jgi:hypothetical protein
MADYRVRKITRAVAEMARNGEAITVDSLRRKAGMSSRLLRQYKELVLETAQQLGANVGPSSVFARE